MVEKKEIWTLQDLFKGKTEKQVLNKVLKLKKTIIKKKQELKKSSAKIILEFIKLNEELELEFSRITNYYSLKTQENINDEDAKAKLDHYVQLASEIDNETMFFDLWFISLKKEKAEQYMNHSSLKEYKQYLKDLIKLKPYTKSEEIEQILNIKNITGRGAFSNLYELITGSFKFKLRGKELTQEDIVSKFSDANPKIREKAYRIVLEKYGEKSNILSEIYKNIVLTWNNENIKIRKYKDAISPRNISNDINNEAVKTMLETIRENSYLIREYFKLKQEFLKQQGKKHPYSRYHVYAPFEDKKKYSYEESKKLVLETYKEFDENFYVKAKKIFDEKHVHSHPQKAKRSGAFCAAPNNQTTPYILLNHTNKLRDLFTMMHEFGHGIHDLYAYEQKNFLFHPVIPLAETASILGETILAKKLLKTENKKQKATLLMYLLDHYYASIIRQAYFVMFEEIAHKKIMQGVTKKELDKDYYKLLKEQFGNMQIPQEFKHEWNYIPHIHNTPFYCYAYSWGNLLVLALYAEYDKNPEFKEKIREILRAGASKDTLEIIKNAGIDVTKKSFWQQGFNIIKQDIEEFKGITRKK